MSTEEPSSAREGADRSEDSVERKNTRRRRGNHRRLARYFPEIVAALQRLPAPEIVLDGELLVRLDSRFDFSAVLARLHPAASRVERLRVETPAVYIAFDVLARGQDDLRG